METMFLSGYSETWRKETVIAARKGVEAKQELEARGGRKVYRLQEEGARDRHNRKINLNVNWFKDNNKNNKNKNNENVQAAPTKCDKLRPPQQWLSNKEKQELDSEEVERPYEGVVFIPFTKEGKLR